MSFFFTKKETELKTDLKDLAFEFANTIVVSVDDIVGIEHVRTVLSQKAGPEIFTIDKKGNIVAGQDFKFPEHIKLVLNAVIEDLEKSFGREFVENKLAYGWYSFKKKYREAEAVLSSVISCVPDRYLEDEKLRFLSKEQLEKRVMEKTKELQNINDNLEKMVLERTKRLEELLKEREMQESILKRRGEELMKANEELLSLDKIKSEFVSVAAHQLRTPLTGMKWTFDLLTKGDFGILSDEQRTYLLKAEESNNRMIAMVNDLLNVDKIQSGKDAYKWEAAVHIDEMLEKIMPDFEMSAKQKHVTVDFRKEKVSPIRADAQKMQVVFQNIIDNAIKYSKENGVVEISVKNEGRNILVTVSDHGIGVPRDQQGELFKRFFRGENAVRYQMVGTGLGLFIAKSVLEKHGGSIEFKETGGGGSTFVIYLPVK